MSVSVSMPQLGESVTEGTVTRWLKKEGERVEADEPLLEVSTDKVDTEIPSPVAGILRGITVAEDETVAVGAELAVIDEAGAEAADVPAAAAESPAARRAPAEESPAEESPAASPGGRSPGRRLRGRRPGAGPPAPRPPGGIPVPRAGRIPGRRREPAAGYQQPAAYQPPVPPSYEQAPQATAAQPPARRPRPRAGGPGSDVWQRSRPAPAPPPAPPAPPQQAPPAAGTSAARPRGPGPAAPAPAGRARGQRPGAGRLPARHGRRPVRDPAGPQAGLRARRGPGHGHRDRSWREDPQAGRGRRGPGPA